MVAQLPLRLGGLGLRSAFRVAPAAYWASWADCLEMIQRRHPVLAAMFTNALSAAAPSPAPCLQELQQGRVQLTWEGYHECPLWEDLARGVRPRQPEGEPGEWAHGWQFYAAGARDEFARATLMQQRSLRGESQALLRSQSGPCGGRVFTSSSDFYFDHYPLRGDARPIVASPTSPNPLNGAPVSMPSPLGCVWASQGCLFHLRAPRKSCCQSVQGGRGLSCRERVIAVHEPPRPFGS